jgi:hypothetical protein
MDKEELQRQIQETLRRIAATREQATESARLLEQTRAKLNQIEPQRPATEKSDTPSDDREQ